MEEDALFDRSHIEDEPFNALPPPLSPSQDQADPFGDGENGELSKLADVPEAKRKGVKRPQPKLDSNRLTSDRGLPALRTLFNDIRFKGKGHEAEDLRLLMKRMENWAHRLFPKLQFEDFINKVERLGSKKEVQTCLKRIRLDMPLTSADYTSQGGEQEEVPPEEQIFGDPDPFGGEHLSGSPLRLVHSTPAPVTAAPHSDDPSLGSSPPALPSLTEEQRQRMAENRLKALEKRLARQKQQQTESQTVEPQPSESQSTPTEETADVASELPQNASQVLEELPKEDTDPENSGGTRELQQNQPPTPDKESHKESSLEQDNPETSPSPALNQRRVRRRSVTSKTGNSCIYTSNNVRFV
uniref:TIMELESS-interacting protein n=1 Tax=Neogobius melanostomus TaxID=47308 RepID=A0A8C6WJ28_9GOBI